MRALLSVANREGIAELARDLRSLDIDIVATDGTREYLAGEGVEVGSVSDLTQVPPLVGGQVKTFHPAVYAGILARRDVPEQLAELDAQGIGADRHRRRQRQAVRAGGRGPARRASTRPSR